MKFLSAILAIVFCATIVFAVPIDFSRPDFIQGHNINCAKQGISDVVNDSDFVAEWINVRPDDNWHDYVMEACNREDGFEAFQLCTQKWTKVVTDNLNGFMTLLKDNDNDLFVRVKKSIAKKCDINRYLKDAFGFDLLDRD